MKNFLNSIRIWIQPVFIWLNTSLKPELEVDVVKYEVLVCRVQAACSVKVKERQFDDIASEIAGVLLIDKVTAGPSALTYTHGCMATSC